MNAQLRSIPKKPPLGLMPKHIHTEMRALSIQAGIRRYDHENKEIPHEWKTELAELRGATPMIKPAKYIRGEPVYKESDIDKQIVTLIGSENSNHIQKRAKQMSKDVDAATEIVESATSIFSKALDSMLEKQKAISEQSKKSQGQIKDCAHKLISAMEKLDKGMNVEKLERQAEALERAARAISELAAIEESGKLSKIMQALSAKS